MKYLKKKKKKSYGWLLAVGIVCALLAVLALWILGQSDAQQPDPGKDPQQTLSGRNETVQDTQPAQATEPAETETVVLQDYLIETPYCTLRLPGLWADRITVELTDGSAVFFGTVNEQKTELYTFYFGDVRGVCIGFLENMQGGNTAVSLLAAELPENTAWSEADMDSFYAMQESMNDVAQMLSSEPGFTPFE